MPDCGTSGGLAAAPADRTFVHGRGAGRASTPKAVREDAAVGDIETWTADECAAAWGVKTPTWQG